jgi:hypothetical protein
MLLDIPAQIPPEEFLMCLAEPTRECIDEIIVLSPKRTVPPNPDRIPFTSRDFVCLHLESPPEPGPVGHGFTDENLVGPTLYFTFDIAPEPSAPPNGLLVSSIAQVPFTIGNPEDRNVELLIGRPF